MKLSKEKKMKKTKVSRKWFCQIYKDEYEICAFRSGKHVLKFIECNDPFEFGTVTLDARDHARVTKSFADPLVATVGLPWKKYAPQIGYGHL